MQAGTLHRTRLRAANGSPLSASTSLTKGGGPSTPAAEWAGKAKRLAAYARLAPAAKKEDQRRAKAADTAPRTRGGTPLALARARAISGGDGCNVRHGTRKGCGRQGGVAAPGPGKRSSRRRREALRRPRCDMLWRSRVAHLWLSRRFSTRGRKEGVAGVGT